jgi:hypothetical protein
MKKKHKIASIPKHVDQLYKAVDAYVKKNGGKLVIVGGIQIQEWPGDGAMVFHVAVKCLGRKPAFNEP